MDFFAGAKQAVTRTHWAELAAALALVEYFVFFALVGKARGDRGVKAPATTGDPTFERLYRIQANTLEQLILFLPALWLFARYVSDSWAGALGAAFIAGRALYARGYYQEPAKRTTGMLITTLASAALLVGGLVGLVREMVG